MTNNAAQASSGLQIDMLGEEFGHLSLDRLGQQGPRSVAQHLGKRVGTRPWLKQLDDVSIGHGVVDLQAAINRYLAETNENPKPFTWTADPDAIIEKVRRGSLALESIH